MFINMHRSLRLLTSERYLVEGTAGLRALEGSEAREGGADEQQAVENSHRHPRRTLTPSERGA
jgi:hypothetical protein